MSITILIKIKKKMLFAKKEVNLKLKNDILKLSNIEKFQLLLPVPEYPEPFDVLHIFIIFDREVF